MTGVLERGPGNDGALDPRAEAPPAALGPTTRWALAALLAGAGVVHLVMVPSHTGESAVEGVGFLVAGWLQLILAVGILARPTRWMLGVAGGSSVVLIVAWVYSRVFGFPFGAHAGHPESVSIVDGLTVGFEAMIILLAVVGLAGSTRRWMRRDGALATVVPIAVVLLTTVAIASPAARDHASASHGGHVAGAHDDEGHADAHGEDDLGLALLDNGHQHGDGDWVELDPATQAELDGQLALTSELVDRYPRLADAEAAGYRRSGPFSPGLGTHYTGGGGLSVNTDGVMNAESIMNPVLIYDGVAPDAPLAGFMYMVMSEDEPEGFAGPNDHWHYHTNVCVVFTEDGEIDTPFGADLPDVTDEMCEEAGGVFIDFTGWMLHVWTVPEYESEFGVFSDINPAITCPDGTYFTIPTEELGDRDTMCRSG